MCICERAEKKRIACLGEILEIAVQLLYVTEQVRSLKLES